MTIDKRMLHMPAVMERTGALQGVDLPPDTGRRFPGRHSPGIAGRGVARTNGLTSGSIRARVPSAFPCSAGSVDSECENRGGKRNWPVIADGSNDAGFQSSVMTRKQGPPTRSGP